MMLNTPTLTTDRLILRAPRIEDFDTWHAFAISERARYIGGPFDGLGTTWRAFCHVAGMWTLRGYGSFVFSEKGADTPLGMSGPWYPADWPEQELGWTVWSPEAEGKGYAYEAAIAARDYAYTILGWQTAVSYIAPENTRSIALAKRLGSTLDDTADKPHDDDTLVYRHPAPGELK